MQVNATATYRRIFVSSLVRPPVVKRRSLNWDARPNTEYISKKAAPLVSAKASDKLSEAEAIHRAGDGDALHLNTFTGCTAAACMRCACA